MIKTPFSFQGPEGPPGPHGPSGTVNYTKINQIIQAELLEIKRKFN